MIAGFAELPRSRQLRAAAESWAAASAPIEDDALFDEVTALVERPNARASSSVNFAVPQECLILTMKANQKYFPLDAEGAHPPVPWW